MRDELYTPEVMGQIEEIYGKLERLPASKRAIVELMAEAFINGMSAQERIMAEQGR